MKHSLPLHSLWIHMPSKEGSWRHVSVGLRSPYTPKEVRLDDLGSPKRACFCRFCRSVQMSILGGPLLEENEVEER